MIFFPVVIFNDERVTAGQIEGLVTNETADADVFNEALASAAMLRPKLNESDVSGKVDALSRILAVYIVRQLFVSDLKVKRLAHICLKLFADKHPDVLLLCVNALQRDCTDVEPLTRGVSIRTQCSIQNKEISDGALQALQKGSVDSSVYVRKCAAAGLASLYFGCRPDVDEMFLVFERLLGDSEPTVLSTTLMSLWVIVKDSDALLEAGLLLLNQFFLKLASMLPELDWIGQTFGMELVHAYCMRNFSLHSQSNHYMLFLDSVVQIVQYSANSCSVTTGLRVLRELEEEIKLRSQSIELSVANLLAHVPSMLQDQVVSAISGPQRLIKPFLINPLSDSDVVKLAKIRVLADSLTERNANFLLHEVLHYLRTEEDDALIQKFIALIISIGELCPHLHDMCLRSLVGLIDSHNTTTSNESVLAVRAIVYRSGVDDTVMKKTCIYLASIIERISGSQAKASAIWLIRYCHDTVPIVAPNVLRAIAKNIQNEDSAVKLELSLLAITVLSFHESNSTDGSRGAVPKEVSSKLLPLLKELIQYILDVSARDPIIGCLVRAVKSRKLQIVASQKTTLTLPSDVVDDPRNLCRPHADTADSLRAPKSARKIDNHGRSVCSDQSSINRVSASVSVPTTMKNPAPKAAQTLEDLDSFFSLNSVTDIPDMSEEGQAVNGVPESHVRLKKGTLDLTGADWL